ncbi:MAG: DNA polymerase Y family protein [Alphaproteobacteria bacterium]|nr:MAG: DNA polymerase Y family protein [Alphaproteobacteria bacterium]
MASAKPSRRYLAAWFPYLPADRLIRARVEPSDLPLVITEKVKGAQRLMAICPEAKRAGLAVGMTLADSRARIPDLWVEEMDARGDATLLDRIAEDCDRFSPVVMIDAPDGLLLDITGCDHIFGGEANLRRTFSTRMKRAGLHVRTVIASGADTARALARFGRIAIVPPGEEAKAVRSLPIAALGLAEADRLAISRAGLKTIGALADRPSMTFAARFGEKMTLRLRRIQGLAHPPLEARREIPMLWVERRFPEPIGRVEDVESVLFELGQEACTQLGERREGGRVFEASLFRADGAVRRLVIETGRPMRDAATLLRLFRERLDALADPIDPGFGFDLIRLAIPHADPLDALQPGLDGHAVEVDEVADLTDRLSVRFSAERVLRFLPANSHDPDRAVQAVPASFNPLTSDVWPMPEREEAPLRPLHMFNPPQPIRITMAEVPDGPPRIFFWRRKEYVVVRAEGPDRIAPEWWLQPGAASRDYYRIEDASGRRFWLFRAGAYSRETPEPPWFMQGVFA